MRRLTVASRMRRALIVLSTIAGVIGLHPAHAAVGGRHRDIAFSSYRQQHQDIYAMRPDGTGVRNLTRDRHPDFQPAWSPDGRTIAFASLHVGDSHFQQVYTMDARGKERIRLTDVARGNAAEPAWSPDGERIAFHVVYGGAIDDELFVMDADGSHLVQLTHNMLSDSDPAWSPDGSQIAFVRDASIRLMDPEGGAVQRVTPDGMLAFDPAWSPDGGWIAFTGWPATSRGPDLYVIRPDGSEMRLPRASVPFESDPSWSPDGQRIVYALTRYHYEDETQDDLLCTIRIDGTHRKVLSSDPHVRDAAPDWRRPSH